MVFHPSHRPLEIAHAIPTVPQPRRRRSSLTNKQNKGTLLSSYGRGHFYWALTYWITTVAFSNPRMILKWGWSGKGPALGVDLLSEGVRGGGGSAAGCGPDQRRWLSFPLPLPSLPSPGPPGPARSCGGLPTGAALGQQLSLALLHVPGAFGIAHPLRLLLEKIGRDARLQVLLPLVE